MSVNNDIQTDAVSFDKSSRLHSILVVILGKPAQKPTNHPCNTEKVTVTKTHYNLPVIVTGVGLILSEI